MTLGDKPFTIILLSVLSIAIVGSMVVFGLKNKGNMLENIDYLRQKMTPAFNETTGFLVISYAVILCIGNVIMKTSPKYLASGGESPEDKTTGFVAWLQSKGLGWLPIFISVTVISLMTFLPINNKILKIGIIAIVLGVTMVVALFFNAIIKLFGGKEKLTDVKEEFGFDETKVKEPVRASYIAYYCLVWGSFLVYSVVTAFQQRTEMKSFLQNIGPFMGAAFVETSLIAQSHLSLNEGDGDVTQASPTFNYAVAGFSTRIATVVAFISSILTRVHE